MTSFDVKVNLGKVPLIPGRMSTGLTVGLDAAALYVKGDASHYPGVRRKKVAQFWTKKQRGYFFYALKKGLIDVPYTRGSSARSQRLGARWGIRAKGNTRTIGNNATYSPYLHSPKTQSLYHRGNWRNLNQIGKAVSPQVRRIVKAAIVGKLQGR